MTARRGRSPGFMMSDAHRTKIENSQILNRLIAHAKGEIQMTMTQVTVGLALIKKILPDLQSVELSGKDGGAIEICETSARDVLLNRLAGLATRQDDADKPSLN